MHGIQQSATTLLVLFAATSAGASSLYSQNLPTHAAIRSDAYLQHRPQQQQQHRALLTPTLLQVCKHDHVGMVQRATALRRSTAQYHRRCDERVVGQGYVPSCPIVSVHLLYELPIPLGAKAPVLSLFQLHVQDNPNAHDNVGRWGVHCPRRSSRE